MSKHVSLLDLPDDLGEELDTSESSAGVTSMSKLAKTFDDPDEMKNAYSEVMGFKSKTQEKIISKSEGDIGAIPDLVEKPMRESLM